MSKFIPKESAERIIDAARGEFAEHGLAGARVDRIASRAGLNKAMIYYHFDSKEKLYRTVIEKQLEQLQQFVEESRQQLDDPEEIFRRLPEFYIAISDRFREFLPILFREIISGGGYFKEILSDLGGFGAARLLQGALENGKEKEIFRDFDNRQVLVSFIGMNLFYLMMEPVAKHILEIDNEEEFKKGRAEAVSDLFFNGIRRR